MLMKIDTNVSFFHFKGNNMSVLGSQLEIDLDPEGECVIFAGQRHVGNTGTGCYKLHDHRIRDTKKEPTIPPDEKIEATYMYAPTPDEEEDEEEGPEEAAEDATPSDDSDKKQQNGGPGGPGGASQPTSSAPELNGKSQMNNGSSVSSQLNNKTPHTPHLLDEPVQGAQNDRTDQLTPAVMQQQQKQEMLNSPSQKSSSIGVRQIDTKLYFLEPLLQKAVDI